MKRSDILFMSVLPSYQPWAHLILNKGKCVENKARVLHMRGTVALHAPKQFRREYFEAAREIFRNIPDPEDLEFGAILGFVTITGVITPYQTRKTKGQAKWHQCGFYGLILDNIISLKTPVPVKGTQGFWKLKGTPLKVCLDQLTNAQIATFQPFQKPK